MFQKDVFIKLFYFLILMGLIYKSTATENVQLFRDRSGLPILCNIIYTMIYFCDYSNYVYIIKITLFEKGTNLD